MPIKTVAIIGLGSLGILFGNHLSKKMPQEDLRIIVDKERITRYQRDGVYSNGEPCNFYYMLSEERSTPADLIIFAVKSTGLEDAVQQVKNQVGNNTIFLSLLNGITSEEIIGRTYGMKNILYCVAQGMDAVKVGNQMVSEKMGMLCFGDREPGIVSENAKMLQAFFEQTAFPYELETDMHRRLWGKFMVNVGLNQTVAVYGSTYGDIQREGSARDIMIAAMREVMTLSASENVDLTEKDLDYWLQIISTLNPQGKPSMRQDVEARRCSEVALFAGTVLELGRKHHVSTPVNQMLYEKITRLESRY